MAKRGDYIAVDLGAESGRVMLGTMADGKLSLRRAGNINTMAMSVIGFELRV